MAGRRFPSPSHTQPPCLMLYEERLDVRGEMNFPLAFQLLFTAQLRIMQNLLETVPELDREAVKADLYDKYNYSASNVLSYFAPEIELRPDLTAEAIMKAEDELMAIKIAQDELDKRQISLEEVQNGLQSEEILEESPEEVLQAQ